MVSCVENTARSRSLLTFPLAFQFQALHGCNTVFVDAYKLSDTCIHYMLCMMHFEAMKRVTGRYEMNCHYYPVVDYVTFAVSQPVIAFPVPFLHVFSPISVSFSLRDMLRHFDGQEYSDVITVLAAIPHVTIECNAEGMCMCEW